METMALITTGHSQYDDDFYRLMKDLTNNTDYKKGQNAYDDYSLDYFEFLPTFIVCGASVENESEDGLNVIKIKADKDSFLKQLKHEFPVIHYEKVTNSQLKYLRHLVRETEKLKGSKYVKDIKLNVAMDNELGKGQAGVLIGLLGSFVEYAKEEDKEYFESEHLKIELSNVKDDIKISLKGDN